MSLKNKIIRILLLVGFISLSAQFSYNFSIGEEQIPITGQSLAVMVACIFLSPIEALVLTGLYLAIGIAGLPVFANGGSGIEKISGNSGGFLYGFVLCGFFISLLGKAGFTRSFFKALIAMLLATALLLAVGNMQLAQSYEINEALNYGFYPFWKAALIKAVIGAVLIVFLAKSFNTKSYRI